MEGSRGRAEGACWRGRVLERARAGEGACRRRRVQKKALCVQPRLVAPADPRSIDGEK